MNAQGAALFSIFPRSREATLLRTLVAYQVALDYLDTLTEKPAEDELRHGMQLHRALVDALDLGHARADYFGHRPWEDDGGYLAALVETCRDGCSQLASFDVVRGAVLRAAEGLSVQVLNHISDATKRGRALRAWSELRRPEGTDVAWFEYSGAASSTLGIYALLAMAAESRLGMEEVVAVDAAYHPWVCVSCTMMDSLVDAEEDAAHGAHSYVGYYASPEVAVERMAHLIAEAMRRVGALPKGPQHAIVVSGMVSMYLSKRRDGFPSGYTARRIRDAAGWLTAVEVPVTRIMRARP